MVRELSVKQFKARYEEDPKCWNIVDVRESWEIELLYVKQAVHVPLSLLMEMPYIADERIDWRRSTVFICRSGGRSMQAARFLEQKSDEIYNLYGGVGELRDAFPDIIELCGEECQVYEYLS